MSYPVAGSDEALALEAAQGSGSAFESLVDRYGGRVVGVFERRIGDHHAALDLAQEAWVRVFSALPRFRPDRSFRSWLFSIALNAARDEGRRRQRSPLLYTDELDPAREARDATDRQAIEASLSAVPEPFRTTLVLVDIEGFSYEEAAVSQECSVGTIKSRVHRGRTAFRGLWERLTTPRQGSPDDRATQRCAGPHERHSPEAPIGAAQRAAPSGRPDDPRFRTTENEK